MEATKEEVTSVLTDALTGYSKTIDLKQKLHDISQPRQGKGVETHTDVAGSEYFQSRSLVTETCLRFSARIASNVRKWAGGAEEEEKKVGMEGLIDLMPPPSISCYALQAEEDDDPYINPMTGKWIYPITSRSAGPSNWYSSETQRDFFHPKQKDTKPSPSSKKGKEREGPRSITCHEDPVDFSSPDDSKSSNKTQFLNLFDSLVEAAASSYIRTGRDSTQPSINPLSDQHRSATSLDFDMPCTCTSNTDPQNSLPQSSNSTDLSFEGDIAATLKQQFECANSIPKSIRDNDLLQASSPHDQVDMDFLTAQRLQAEFDDEVKQQELYARQIQQAEQQLYADREHGLEEARRLASQWNAQDETTHQEVKYRQEKWQQDDPQIAAQADFVKEVLRAEEERQESIRRDMAAAMAVMQWESEALELEQQARQAAEEAERKEEEERRRFSAEMAERERIARLEAKRGTKEERRRKMAECVSCMEEGERAAMCLLACGHGYCSGCVAEAVRSATKSRTAFKCCGTTVPTSSASRFLPAALLTTYTTLLSELSTSNPNYCSNRNCSLFIPPTSITGPLAICPSCSTRTCALCSQAEHPGVCRQDVAGQKVLDLAGKKGWKSCPNCKAVLERTEGCLHMTCRCGAEWCYSCLGDWRNCRSTCSRM